MVRGDIAGPTNGTRSEKVREPLYKRLITVLLSGMYGRYAMNKLCCVVLSTLTGGHGRPQGRKRVVTFPGNWIYKIQNF